MNIFVERKMHFWKTFQKQGFQLIMKIIIQQATKDIELSVNYLYEYYGKSSFQIKLLKLCFSPKLQIA